MALPGCHRAHCTGNRQSLPRVASTRAIALPCWLVAELTGSTNRLAVHEGQPLKTSLASVVENNIRWMWSLPRVRR